MARAFASVGIPGRRSRAYGRQPQKVLIRQREYEHDVAVFTYLHDRGIPARFQRFGQPVKVTWGYVPGEIENFVGYVHHKKTKRALGKPATTTIYCVSASHVFNQRRRTSYRYYNLSSALQKLARRHRFAFATSIKLPTSKTQVNKAQVGRSDWKMAVTLAQQAGFSLNAERTVLRLSKREIRRARGRYFFVFDPAYYRQRNAVHSFEQVHGGLLPTNQPWVDESAIVDDRGKYKRVTSQQSGGDIRATFNRWSQRTYRTRLEALDRVSARKTLEKFRVTVKAQLSGAAGVRPSDNVRLIGVDSAFTGDWYVNGVDHVITPGKYVMDIDLGRERLNEVPVTTPGITPGITAPVTEPVTSWQDKPQVFIDPETGYQPEPVPETVFIPPMQEVPVEVLVPQPLGDPLPAIPPPAVSPARALQRERRTAGRKPRAPIVDCCDTPPVQPRLDGWRATVVGGRR
jgi:phage protein D